MINVRTLKNLKENDGLTLKKGKRITYKTGWQVATEGIETTDPYVAIKAVKEYGGACKQISILKWANMSLAYC